MRIEPMDEEGFADMATWKYEPPYDFYDGDAYPVENPERYFAARDDDGELIGHYYFELNGDVLDYGLGLRPGLVGRGIGLEYFEVGLEFGRDVYAPRLIRLHVAAFNQRAVTVYERAGFREVSRHVRHLPEVGGDFEFVTMEEQ